MSRGFDATITLSDHNLAMGDTPAWPALRRTVEQTALAAHAAAGAAA